jgi:hypothetical protein
MELGVLWGLFCKSRPHTPEKAFVEKGRVGSRVVGGRPLCRAGDSSSRSEVGNRPYTKSRTAALLAGNGIVLQKAYAKRRRANALRLFAYRKFAHLIFFRIPFFYDKIF